MTTHDQSLSIRRVRAVSMTVAFVAFLGMMAPSAHALDKVSELLESTGFDTLRSALDAAGLTSDLDANTVTLFAPTDEAFEDTADDLGCDSVDELLESLLRFPLDGTSALASLLSYHVFLGKLNTQAKVLTAGKPPMMNGKTIKTGANENGLFVEGKKNKGVRPAVTAGPLAAQNGSTVYAIDQLLLPIDPKSLPVKIC